MLFAAEAGILRSLLIGRRSLDVNHNLFLLFDWCRHHVSCIETIIVPSIVPLIIDLSIVVLVVPLLPTIEPFELPSSMCLCQRSCWLLFKDFAAVMWYHSMLRCSQC